eukprot:SAG22_NODE_219_length_14877_cov_14.334619_6_plen_53_part_00
MMCEYAGADYEAKCYPVEAKEGGGWSGSSAPGTTPPALPGALPDFLRRAPAA